jgi:WhiB family transcriptional regulator, redox-sensing transcriptional regulator
MIKSAFATDETPAIRRVLSEAQGWRRSALCLGRDPEMWYPTGAGGVEAAAICEECPVRLECLKWALANNERDGIWGGVSARKRQGMLAKERPVPNPSVFPSTFSTSKVP